MPTEDVFEVLDLDFQPTNYVARADYHDIERNLRKAKKNPGRWCTIGVFDTIKIASDVRRTCVRRYAKPGLTFKSQTLDGVSKLMAHYALPDEEPKPEETS